MSFVLIISFKSQTQTWVSLIDRFTITYVYLFNCLATEPDNCVLDPSSSATLVTSPDEYVRLQLDDTCPSVLPFLYDVFNVQPTDTSS